MEKFYFEEPSLKRKEDAMDYINEHVKYNSNINGSGSLAEYVLNKDKTYEQWLEQINNNKSNLANIFWVPSKTYFLVRESDEKIVGMINIRLSLNDYLKDGAGHIGYGIRKSKQGMGYATKGLKMLIELAKKIIPENEIYLSVHKDNLASLKVQQKNGAYIDHEDEEEYYTRIKL